MVASVVPISHTYLFVFTLTVFSTTPPPGILIHQCVYGNRVYCWALEEHKKRLSGESAFRLWWSPWELCLVDARLLMDEVLPVHAGCSYDNNSPIYNLI
ncbi:hypothetical protein HOY80DRAFT_969611 [Tuber brumale]|nr:hypothetical protein HOY80DRAFT_969611 [Tuber brumale]